MRDIAWARRFEVGQAGSLRGGWRPTLRTNGFGNLRYQSGWFKTAAGRKIGMYRAGGRRLVLLPPKDGSAPVLL